LTFEAVGSEVTMGVRRHRRYSTEFKLQLVESYLAGDGSAHGLAREHGIPHTLLRVWAEKYRKGELTLDVQREEQLQEYQLKIAALERKVGQLTMELDLLKKGLAVAPPPNNGSSSIISGPGGSPSRGGAA
jgi:transposase-like protein